MITRERDYEIRMQAVYLLKECGINPKKTISLKDIIENSKSHNIYHENRNLGGLLGFSCYHGDCNKYQIVTDIEENNIFERHKLTIAHEIGHIILKHLNSNASNTIILNDLTLEREAYIFADELLIPTMEVIRLGLNAEEIKRIYNVSNEAASNKIKYAKNNSIFLDYMEHMDNYFNEDYEHSERFYAIRLMH